jgi:hypothetical protein
MDPSKAKPRECVFAAERQAIVYAVAQKSITSKPIVWAIP